jgi:hypothetical protein
MKDCRWVLAALGLLGCSGQVDLGEANPGPASQAVGSALLDFAPTPWGMCANFENRHSYCWGWEGETHARRIASLDAKVLSSSEVNEQICVIEDDGSVGCTSDYREAVTSSLGMEDAVKLSVGFGAGCTLRADGTLQRWSSPGSACTVSSDPVELPSPAVQVDCPQETIGGCAVTADGRLFCFGSELNPGCQQLQPVAGIDDAIGVAVTMEQVCVLHRGGRVSCATLGTFGAIGVFAAPLTEVKAAVELRSSRVATCALEQSGQLKCWGLSQCGALGIAEDCENTNVPTPIVVHQEIETQRFGMSDSLLCSEDAAGQVWCWGFSDWDGQARGNPLARRILF